MLLVRDALARARRRLRITAFIAALIDVAMLAAIASAALRVLFPFAGLVAPWIAAAVIFPLVVHAECARRARSRAYIAKQIDRDNALDDLFVTVAAQRDRRGVFEDECVRRLAAHVAHAPLKLSAPRVGRSLAVAVTLAFVFALGALEWRERAAAPVGASEATIADPPGTSAPIARASGASRSDGDAPDLATPDLPRASTTPHAPSDRRGGRGHGGTASSAIDERATRGGQGPDRKVVAIKRPGALIQPGPDGPVGPGGAQAAPLTPGPGDHGSAEVPLQLAGKWRYAPSGTLVRGAASAEPGALDAYRAALEIGERTLEEQVTREEIPARHAGAIQRYFSALRSLPTD